MSSRCDVSRWAGSGLAVALLAAVSFSPSGLPAQEFGASIPPAGRYVLRVFPKATFAAAYFSDKGKALNLETVTGLFYVELPIQVQYSLTSSLAVGAILPLGWTQQEVLPEIRKDPIRRFAVREAWLTLQHKWPWTPFGSSSASVRVKLPLSDKKEWEDGLRIGDGQVDIFPVYYFEYENEEQYWFTELSIGYKYRFEKGDIKPFDELNFRSVLGFELYERPKLEVFIFADLTDFRNGDYGRENLKFFEQDGSLHTFGYGTIFEPHLGTQIYLETSGDLSGRNRYRAMRWAVGLRKYFGGVG